MVSHSDIAYNFSIGTKKDKGSRMFIEDDTIYSYGYHFKIAQRMPIRDNIDYLFNTEEYSVSTAKHKRLVLNQLTGTILHIKDCNLDNAEEQYKDNKTEIEELKQKIGRARAEHIINQYETKIRFLIGQNNILCTLAIKTKLLNSVGGQIK